MQNDVARGSGACQPEHAVLKGVFQMDRGHLIYLYSHLRATRPGMCETKQTPNNPRLLCMFEMWVEKEMRVVADTV
jgi:hypothetical protein